MISPWYSESKGEGGVCGLVRACVCVCVCEREREREKEREKGGGDSAGDMKVSLTAPFFVVGLAS